MIEMWDDLFTNLNDSISTELQNNNGDTAFELMHAELDKAWNEVSRVLTDDGIACINIGDATRKLGDSFQLYPNHSRITTAFTENGFSMLPSILWRKPNNSAAKFMGSGMLPPNQYVTLEHEHILIFRNSDSPRDIPDSDLRRKSAYFYEERNKWFSDTWDDITGETQQLDVDSATRNRSAAYPVTIPYRLMNMFSIYTDTVLDPFIGTGTTTRAAMIAARNSYGYELDASLINAFDDTVSALPQESERVAQSRLDDHAEHVDAVLSDASVEVTTDVYSYQSTKYPIPVRSQNETEIEFYTVSDVTRNDSGSYQLYHTPHDLLHSDTDTPTAVDPNQLQLDDI
jgi:DNA modification methylase